MYCPYVYLLKYKPTKQLYIGAEYSILNKVANPSNFWNIYFTSSNVIQNLRESSNDQTDWSFRILKTFSTEKETIEFEQYLLEKYNAADNPRFLNQRNGGGGNHSIESRKKMSLAKKGKPNGQKGTRWTEERRQRTLATRERNGTTGRGRKAIFTEEHRANLSKSRKGIVFSEEHRANLSKSHLGNKSSNAAAMVARKNKHAARTSHLFHELDFRNRLLICIF